MPDHAGIERRAQRGDGSRSAYLSFGTTVIEALRGLEREGFVGSFRVSGPEQVQCLSCRDASDAIDVHLERLVRVEGVSDPADEEAVMGLVCPLCKARGTLILAYGSDASAEEAGVLVRLQDERPEA